MGTAGTLSGHAGRVNNEADRSAASKKPKQRTVRPAMAFTHGRIMTRVWANPNHWGDISWKVDQARQLHSGMGNYSGAIAPRIFKTPCVDCMRRRGGLRTRNGRAVATGAGEKEAIPKPGTAPNRKTKTPAVRFRGRFFKQ